jgi:hypothetical protein
MERTWGKFFGDTHEWKNGIYFPKCLHVLGRRGGLNDDEMDRQIWMGKVKELKCQIRNDLFKFKSEIFEAMKLNIESTENQLKENLKALDESIKLRIESMKQDFSPRNRRLSTFRRVVTRMTSSKDNMNVAIGK